MSTHLMTQKQWIVANRQRLLEEFKEFVKTTGIHVRWKEWVSDEWQREKQKHID